MRDHVVYKIVSGFISNFDSCPMHSKPGMSHPVGQGIIDVEQRRLCYLFCVNDCCKLVDSKPYLVSQNALFLVVLTISFLIVCTIAVATSGRIVFFLLLEGCLRLCLSLSGRSRVRDGKLQHLCLFIRQPIH